MKTKILFIAMLILGTAQINAQTIMNIHQNNGTVLQIPVNTIDSITYTILDPGNLATITTLPVENINSTSAVTGGNISNTGGTTITQRGVCWSINPNPTTANNSTNDGSGTGSFNSSITGLAENTTYYVRAYAINNAGTAYGNELNFTTSDGGGGIVSNPGPGVTFGGYTYSTIVLGNGQEWMSENLRTTHYANGDPVPNISDSEQWNNLSTGAWVHYSNDNSNENPYGKLYNWFAAVDSRNVCPTGWHVPSDAEWNTLIGYLDPSFDPNSSGLQSYTAGGKMKSTGTQFWVSPNPATNESGFSGQPGGFRHDYGFVDVGIQARWWSATPNLSVVAWYRKIENFNTNIDRDTHFRRVGMSIRCLKD